MSSQEGGAETDRIDEMEAALALEPESAELREELVEAYARDDAQSASPRRFEHIRWFIRRRPCALICRTPYMTFDPAIAPQAWADLQAEWFAVLRSGSADPSASRAAALFVAQGRRADAVAILREAIGAFPADPGLWVELGGVIASPAERLECYKRARDLGASFSSLLVWIAQAAVEAGNDEVAEAHGLELLDLVWAARVERGAQLDWTERGSALWERARATVLDDCAAREITSAISDYRYRLHCGHTVLGLVCCHRHDLGGAIAHLHASATAPPDYRLSSRRPSIDLLRAICMKGCWRDASAFLETWAKMHDDDVVRRWVADVEMKRLPVEVTRH